MKDRGSDASPPLPVESCSWRTPHWSPAHHCRTPCHRAGRIRGEPKSGRLGLRRKRGPPSHRDFGRQDRIESIRGNQFTTVRADVPYTQNRLGWQLTLYGQVVVKRVRGSEVLRDDAQVRTNLKLGEVDVGRPWARSDVGKLIGDGKSAGDIMEGVGKRRIVEVCSSGGIRHSQSVQAKGSDSQVLQVQFLFTTVEVQTEAAADGRLAVSTCQAPTPIRGVCKTRSRTNVVVFGACSSVGIATWVPRQGITKGSRGEDLRLHAGLEANTG